MHRGPLAERVILSLLTYGWWTAEARLWVLWPEGGAALRYSQFFQKNLVLLISSATFHFLIQLCDQLILKLEEKTKLHRSTSHPKK